MDRKLTIEAKLQILHKLSEPKATQRSVAKEMNVSRKTVQNVIKNRSLISGKSISVDPRKRYRLRQSLQYEEVDKCTFEWFRRMREKHGELPLNENIICEKALKLSTALGCDSFKASRGWFRSWRQRYCVNLYKVCGERYSAPAESVSAFRERLKDLLANYDHRNVFNADETAVYYRALPRKTLELQRVGASGCKQSKERVTLLVCASLLGEKLPPVVIGKFRNPRCFRGISHDNLPLPYYNSKNGWMTNNLFTKWLYYLNQKMQKQNRKILLFVDNATPHKSTEAYENIHLEYLPANCTAVVQPMDQGVIWSLKCKLRKALLEFVITQADNLATFNLINDVNLLQAMRFMKRAWNDVHPDTIISAFHKAGFCNRPEISTPDEEACLLVENFEEFVSLDDQLFSQETRQVDVDAESDEELWDKQIIGHIRAQKQDEEVEDEEEGEVEASPLLPEAQVALETVKRFCLTVSDLPESILDSLLNVNKFFCKQATKAELHKKQKKLSDFWK